MGELQGTGNPGDSRGGRKKEGPDHRRTVKIANLKIGTESRGIRSLCLVLELHHTIMSKLWDLGGRTKRKECPNYEAVWDRSVLLLQLGSKLGQWPTQP